MDLERYFEQLENSLQKDLENTIRQSIQEFCPYCGEEILSGSVFCPYCGEDLVVEKPKEEKQVSKLIEQPKSNYRPLYKLPFFEGLEEETKKKIRTFEHVYQKAYEEETKRPLISTFGEKASVEDFSPLIMSLSSALEIELNKSVLPLMLQNYGKKIIYGKKEIELDKQITLRVYQFCIYYDCYHKNYLNSYGLHKAEECGKALNRIIKKRNKSGHIGVASSKSFYTFYDDIYDFFQVYMEDLIKVKNHCKKKNKASVFGLDSSLFFNNEKELVPATEQETEFVPKYKKGILFTDTLKLAHKLFDSETTTYNGVLVSTQQMVENILKEYMQNMASVGIVYDLLDICHYTDIEAGKWQSYARCLDNYRNRNYPQFYKEKIGLFIIGGNDVIPMPQVVNPFFMEGLDEGGIRVMNAYSKKGELLSDRTLDADMLYAYCNKHSCILNHKQEVDCDVILKCEPLFWAGRLPLEEGVVSPLNSERSAYQEFSHYFTRSFAAYVEDVVCNGGTLGIIANKHVATSCESSQIAMGKMLEGIPFTMGITGKGSIQGKKYISPNLNLQVADKLRWNYIADIEETDMLTFFLHGGNKPANYHYCGENKERTCGGYIAFKPELLLSSNVKIISGVCCWGARFIGYPKVQSTLLTAMYSSTLLFMGASRCAAGLFDDAFSISNMDIAFSELLLKYYLNYLLQGYDAGEALGRAKMDYIQTEKYSRMDALATMLEFNLFGDPLLSVQPVLEKQPVITKKDWNTSSVSCGSFRNYSQVFDCKKNESHSILDRVRGLVDRRLYEVRQRVIEQLYKDFNINPQSLSTIHSFHSENGEEGYRFCFHEKNEYYNNDRVVDTDKNGNVTCVIGFF